MILFYHEVPEVLFCVRHMDKGIRTLIGRNNETISFPLCHFWLSFLNCKYLSIIIKNPLHHLELSLIQIRTDEVM